MTEVVLISQGFIVIAVFFLILIFFAFPDFRNIFKRGNKSTSSPIEISTILSELQAQKKALSLLEDTVIKSFSDLLQIDKERSTSISKLVLITDDLKKRLGEIESETQRNVFKINEFEQEIKKNATYSWFPQING